MSINFEVKGQLAKLLATEDLVVEHRHVETAMFNVHTRVLTLPMWKKASEEVFDMLVAHEVGHALFTPDEWDWTTPKQFVNVVEDARIEKLMKRKYAGLSKTFYRGYSELSEEDFFALENENVEAMNLADRANLYFKIGNFTSIHIDDGEEKDIINMIAKAETFEDALEAAEVLYNYCKKPKEENTTPVSNQTPQPGNAEGEETPSESEDSSEESSDEAKDTVDTSENLDLPPQQEEPTVKTVESLEDAISELLADNNGFGETVYLELPEVNLDTVIIDNKEIHDACHDLWKGYDGFPAFDWVDTEYRKFKKSAQKEVNYLVKEFECKKAADSYARATTSRTGVLDCSKLHTYKYNEDLFKKVTTLAEGKNHGLVFVLDWSGSMGSVLEDTLKQLFNLMWFCKKASIPFEVYAFTNEYPKDPSNEEKLFDLRLQTTPYEKREGLIAVGPWFSMMNVFTSDVKLKELERQMRNFYRLSYNMTRWSNAPIPTGLGLSGTPLNEAFISLHQILPQFKKQHKIQKVQCVVLTDGEAGGMKYHKEVQRRWEEGPFLGVGSVQQNAFLRNRKTGNTYSFDCEWWQMSDIFLKDLRDSFTDVNFIGIRVLESRDAGAFIRRYAGWTPKFEKIQKVWKKERAFALHDAGYHTYFGMSAAALSNDAEFDVDEGATKAKIKSAFAKSLKNKKMNKKVLGEFIELIA